MIDLLYLVYRPVVLSSIGCCALGSTFSCAVLTLPASNVACTPRLYNYIPFSACTALYHDTPHDQNIELNANFRSFITISCSSDVRERPLSLDARFEDIDFLPYESMVHLGKNDLAYETFLHMLALLR